MPKVAPARAAAPRKRLVYKVQRNNYTTVAV